MENIINYILNDENDLTDAEIDEKIQELILALEKNAEKIDNLIEGTHNEN